ncbi:hypothetical protein H5407_19780 [Mitsuaria sp. WAJ17]|uniref:hypothetical protein n=1 Tax=Mitsuaria sp. WAJ17 TaxID=2761452 RepID=UPI0016009330|nr:hypothetical protein [Mitsuaria sp. WAJ17]MBB2487480.1 hypothetical protein [Mitsuaria sp. WAJ17]
MAQETKELVVREAPHVLQTTVSTDRRLSDWMRGPLPRPFAGIAAKAGATDRKGVKRIRQIRKGRGGHRPEVDLASVDPLGDAFSLYQPQGPHCGGARKPLRWPGTLLMRRKGMHGLED